MKFFEKLRKIGKRGKAMICTALATVSMAAMTVAASASESGTESASMDMSTVMKNAGDSLVENFNTLLQTMIPVILGILGSGLVIFGLLALIKLAKKVFGKVAG